MDGWLDKANGAVLQSQRQRAIDRFVGLNVTSKLFMVFLTPDNQLSRNIAINNIYFSTYLIRESTSISDNPSPRSLNLKLVVRPKTRFYRNLDFWCVSNGKTILTLYSVNTAFLSGAQILPLTARTHASAVVANGAAKAVSDNPLASLFAHYREHVECGRAVLRAVGWCV